MDLRQEFYRKLDYKKISINTSDKKRIKMDLFLSFLTIDVERSKRHLGSSNGWTKLTNKEHKLIVSGGVLNGVEYLDSVQYGENLHNPYNNWVTPLNMFDILNKEGRAFFMDFYQTNIDKIIESSSNKIDRLKKELEHAKTLKREIINEVSMLQNQ